jgi:hypothetical protein
VSRQQVKAGGYIDALTGEEAGEVVRKLHEHLTATDALLARGVQRWKARSVPVAITASAQIVMSSSLGVAGPDEGMCVALHRVTINSTSVNAVAGNIFAIAVTGSEGDDLAVPSPDGNFAPPYGTVAQLAAEPGMMDKEFGKGAVTMYPSEKLAIVSLYVPPATSGYIWYEVEGFLVPRSLLWKLVI